MTGLVSLYKKATQAAAKIPFPDLALGARWAVAFPFYSSGRTKAESGAFNLDLNSFTVDLFRDEYAVPFLSPELAAQLALYGETILPILLALGLFTRFASAGLLVMIAVITVSYESHSVIESLSWGAALVALLWQGGGRFSLDALACKLFARAN